MRAVIQRVRRASVSIADQEVARIERGIVALVGIAPTDSARDAEWIAQKIVGLRIFDDVSGRMNRSLVDASGALLAVSQFTLLADCRKGRRPSFVGAASPDVAQPLFDHFVCVVRACGVVTETGRFGADMQVELVNDGPATIVLDSPANPSQ